MIKYLTALILTIFFVFNQVFFFDLFTLSIKVTLLLICYIMIKDVNRESKQMYIFLLFLFSEILLFNYPGIMTLIVLILEYLYEYLKKLFQINFIFIFEYFSYFIIYFYFIENLFSLSFFVNLFISICIFLIFLGNKYGFAKIFRIWNQKT